MATNRVKGITVEIGGDTTKLDKALAGTNKQLTYTQKSLKDVERLLKLDPGNAELLAQKQRLLAQAADGTAQKLDILRQAAQNADEALQRGQAYQEKYQPLKAELDSVAASMKGLEASAAAMQSKLEGGEISTEQYDAFAQKLEVTRKRYQELQKAVKDLDQEFSGARMDQSQYDALQREIIATELELESLETQSKESTSALKKLGSAAGDVSKKAAKIKDTFAPITKGIAAVSTAAIATVPATEDMRVGLSMLDQNAKNAGVGLDSARTAFEKLNAVSGETDSSIEAVSNLLAAGVSENRLQLAVEGLANAAIQFPDTVKIESLADSLQETLATGEATGQFAEVLDRLGIGAEKFSETLALCMTEAQKQDAVFSTLVNGPLNGVYEGWVKANAEMIESRDTTLELQYALADLADSLLPLISDLSRFAATFLGWFTSLDEGTRMAVIGIAAVLAAISPVAGAVETVSGVLSKLDGISNGLGLRMGIVVTSIGMLVMLATQVAAAWDDMTGVEKVIAILGMVAAAAVTAAIALGAFQSALTLGIAAAAIVAGVLAVTAAVNSAAKRANQAAQSVSKPQTSAYGTDIPGFADGGVVPPNDPFLAVLGDNKRETEIVAPYSTIKQAAGDAFAERGGQSGVVPLHLYVHKGGGMMREFKFSLDSETRRQGSKLTEV